MGQTVSSATTFLLLGALGVVVVLAALALGALWLRWRLAEARGAGGRRSLPRRRQRLPQPVVYVVKRDHDDLIPVPSGEWPEDWQDEVWVDDGLPF